MSFNFFGLLNSEYERKRDYYSNLCDDLQENITDYSNYLVEIDSMFNSYKSKMPHPLSGSIPSNDFEPKHAQLDEKLAKCISTAKEKKASLIAAKQAAYNQYIYYKNKAEEEERKG